MDAAAATLPRTSGSVDRLVRLAETDMAGVNRLITERMQSDVPIIPALAEHLIAAGGKRLRPLLTVAAARLAASDGAGSDNDHCLKLAAAVEFIHTATLLHDDVVDGSALRRGKVAAHLIWGGAQSVLVGDFLFARAFELMVETNSMKALEILARASRVIAEGEVMQLMRSHDLNLSQALYLEIIQAKTAELFAAASEAGAVSAGVDLARTDALKAYGLNLGLAFQLVDDALDYGGATETLGKNAGDDFREGKATLPLLLAIARSGPREAEFWERAVGRREQTEADFRRARELIIGTGALDATLDLATDYADKAKAALAIFPANDWRESLESLADFAVSRTA
ncbi:polyprenyl synthetase family protein [Caulobacter sp. CCH9-E1]|uniref:polyprenyl synthetase family protein n=1 Tax=Caulobacter sp. CCH9-E1 TaxID=1768768 RepID=UPI000A50BD6A|nr:polyprenyl synthetase family protein [Caulobacter sp. CCH9-E1]